MFNPAKASSNIKEEFIDYIATTHAFSNSSLQEQFIKELRANIARGPLLEIKDVFKCGKSIEEMIEDADCPLSPLFREIEAGKPKDNNHKHNLPRVPCSFSRNNSLRTGIKKQFVLPLPVPVEITALLPPTIARMAFS